MVGRRQGRRDVRLARADGTVRRRRLGVRRPVPVLAVGGTTAALAPELSTRLMPVLRAAVGVAADTGAAVVTGGTDAGVFHLLSLSMTRGPRPAALVGVAPDALVAPTGEVPVDPQLTALVRVPGDAWGVETPALSRVVGELAGSRPAVALVIGGGDIAADEVATHLAEGRTVVVLAGSGRLADDLARLIDPPPSGDGVAPGPPAALDGDVAALVAGGDVRVVPLSAGAGALEAVLSDALRPHTRRTVRQRVPPLAAMPRFRVRPTRLASLIGPDAALRYPALAPRLTEVDAVVFPAFTAQDIDAQREQNRHRWFLLLAIVGGFLTTTFGAVQAWLQSARWPGVVVATLAAATSALTTVTKRDGALTRFVSSRVRAERLRSLYFEHLALPPAADEAARRDDLRQLRVRVAEIEREGTGM